jgi:transaldolase
VKYVNALVGRDTVTTMSMNTLDAYRDHGSLAPTLERNLLDVCDVFAELGCLGVDLDRVSSELERESAHCL